VRPSMARALERSLPARPSSPLPTGPISPRVLH
jgi:hypothetical protein